MVVAIDHMHVCRFHFPVEWGGLRVQEMQVAVQETEREENRAVLGWLAQAVGAQPARV